MVKNLNDLFRKIKSQQKMILAVAAAHDKEVLLAIKDATEKEIIQPILVGQQRKIIEISKEINFDLTGIQVIDKETIEECAETSVKLVSSKNADFVMKGILDTSIILKAVLNKEWGLRTDSLLSHVMLYEIPSYHKLLAITDAGMNIAPSYDQKVKILKNAIKAMKPLEMENIKVACIAAKEKVNPKMQATVDAKLLQEEAEKGTFGEDVIVEGPLAFDLAVSKKAAEIKKFNSRVSGDVDILLVPTIEVGNGIGKSFTYFAKSKSAGIIMGAKSPVVLVSRADDHQSKLYSIAYGALIAKYNK